MNTSMVACLFFAVTIHRIALKAPIDPKSADFATIGRTENSYEEGNPMTISPTNPRIYDEIIDFLASGTTPQTLVEFQLSDNVKEHVGDLIFREKNSSLTTDEKSELDQFMMLEHILRMAKARAHKNLATI
jgi:hypothetical protein